VLEQIVYIAKGDMGVIKDGVASPLPSQRLVQYERVLRSLEERHAWKTEGAGAQFMGQHNPYAGLSEQKGRVSAVVFSGGRLVYASVTGESGGIFRKDPKDAAAQEGLLYSGASFFIEELDARDGAITASLVQPRGERHIALFVDGKPGYTLLTEGDTLDRHPFLAPKSDAVFYSSAGYARDEQGRILGVGPYGVLKLCRDSGRIEEIFSDPALNCLKYLEDAEGGRYMMVRPYKQSASGPSLKDMLLGPARLLQAFGGFLNLFSMRYGGKPLRTGGAAPAQAKQKSLQELFIEGNLIQAERNLKENQRRGEANPGIVSGDWRLVRIKGDGTLETVRRGVLDYALLPSGGYVYANGKHVIACDWEGRETVLLRDELVTRVAVLPGDGAE
jgi:hypothetical protein